MLDTAYGMVKHTLAYIADMYGVEVIYVEVPVPLADDTLIDAAITAALEKHRGKKIRMASFSHITSVPALILPIERLARLCRENGVERVVVDGAHALGNIEVSMRQLDAAGIDFWVGNGHKWLYSPKGTLIPLYQSASRSFLFLRLFFPLRFTHHFECTANHAVVPYSLLGSAVLWVAPSAQGAIAPTVVSSEWVPGAFQQSFLYTGTRDYTPYVAIGDALDFRERLGPEEIMTYMRELSAWATEHLVRVWGTEALAPAHMTAMSMGNVRVPTTDPEKAATLAKRVYDEHDIYIVVYRSGGDKWWLRLSAQIYLEKEDFVRAGEAVLDVLKT